jgi:exodeoxyribonuclease VII small subunit
MKQKRGVFMKAKLKNYEESISELEEIVEKLEKGDLPLDEAIDQFQKGVELSKYCSKKLDEAEKKITLLLENEKGEIVEEEMKEA